MKVQDLVITNLDNLDNMTLNNYKNELKNFSTFLKRNVLNFKISELFGHSSLKEEYNSAPSQSALASTVLRNLSEYLEEFYNIVYNGVISNKYLDSNFEIFRNADITVLIETIMSISTKNFLSGKIPAASSSPDTEMTLVKGHIQKIIDIINSNNTKIDYFLESPEHGIESQLNSPVYYGVDVNHFLSNYKFNLVKNTGNRIVNPIGLSTYIRDARHIDQYKLKEIVILKDNGYYTKTLGEGTDKRVTTLFLFDDNEMSYEHACLLTASYMIRLILNVRKYLGSYDIAIDSLANIKKNFHIDVINQITKLFYSTELCSSLADEIIYTTLLISKLKLERNSDLVQIIAYRDYSNLTQSAARTIVRFRRLVHKIDQIIKGDLI